MGIPIPMHISTLGMILTINFDFDSDFDYKDGMKN